MNIISIKAPAKINLGLNIVAKRDDGFHDLETLFYPIYNLYDNTNVWYREYDLETTPIVITDVTMLGITPTLFMKVYF